MSETFPSRPIPMARPAVRFPKRARHTPAHGDVQARRVVGGVMRIPKQTRLVPNSQATVAERHRPRAGLIFDGEASDLPPAGFDPPTH
jgi:hypothetical protein